MTTRPRFGLTGRCWSARGELLSLTDVEVSATPVTRLRLLPRTAGFSYLDPTIVRAILESSQPERMQARELWRMADLPLEWAKQRTMLGVHPTDPIRPVGHFLGRSEHAQNRSAITRSFGLPTYSLDISATQSAGKAGRSTLTRGRGESCSSKRLRGEWGSPWRTGLWSFSLPNREFTGTYVLCGHFPLPRGRRLLRFAAPIPYVRSSHF